MVKRIEWGSQDRFYRFNNYWLRLSKVVENRSQLSNVFDRAVFDKSHARPFQGGVMHRMEIFRSSYAAPRFVGNVQELRREALEDAVRKCMVCPEMKHLK